MQKSDPEAQPRSESEAQQGTQAQAQPQMETGAATGGGGGEPIAQVPAAPAAAGAAIEGEGDGDGGEEGAAEPEKPSLRPIDAYPVEHNGQKLLAFYDPSGIATGVVTLPPLGAAVVDLCDGSRTREEICAEFLARYKRPLPRESVDALLQKLDDALLLDSTRFRLHCAKLFAAFEQAPERPAHWAGQRYPAEPEALKAALKEAFAPPNGPGLVTEAATGEGGPAAPRAVIVPCVDFTRAGPAYAWAMRPLIEAKTLPSLIVLLGCDHGAADPTLTFTRKSYVTPLGTLTTDEALLDTLLADAAELSSELPEILMRDGFRHRAEHSLEFLAVWLSLVLSERQRLGYKEEAPKVLPVLVGSLHELASAPPNRESEVQGTGLLDDVSALLQRRIGERQAAGGSVLWLAAADLAHVGPRFGDPEQLDEEDRDSLERRDRQTLKPVLAGDAPGFFAEIRRERDRRRVLGLGTIYALLRMSLATGGQLRCYAQCSVDRGSYISTASVVFP